MVKLKTRCETEESKKNAYTDVTCVNGPSSNHVKTKANHNVERNLCNLSIEARLFARFLAVKREVTVQRNSEYKRTFSYIFFL